MKSISEIIKIMDFGSIEIIEYTQKCIAVIGATKPIKDALKALRGKWNSNLTINGAPSGGWIFPLTRRDDVVAMLIRLKFKTKEEEKEEKEEEEEEEEEETQKRMDRQRKKEKAERKQKRAERRAEKEELEQKQKIAEERADRKQKRAGRREERQRKKEEEEKDQQKIADEHKLLFLSVVMWMISMLIIMGNYINQKPKINVQRNDTCLDSYVRYFFKKIESNLQNSS